MSQGVSMKLGRRLSASVSYVLLIIWGLVATLPLLWMVSSSFKITKDIYVWPPSFLPTNPTTVNYYQAWTLRPIGRYLLNSALVSIIEIAAVVLFGALVGYVLAIRRFPGRNLIWLTVLAGLVVPEQVTYIPRFMMIKQVGWVNTIPGIVSPYLTSCFGIFLLAQFFQSVPIELVDAARMDGLTELGILFRIVLPLSKPALATLTIFTWLGSWNNFFWPLLVVVSENMRTIPIGLASFYQEEGIMNFGNVLAANTTAIIPPLIVFLAFQRYFVQGIGVSGLKDV